MRSLRLGLFLAVVLSVLMTAVVAPAEEYIGVAGLTVSLFQGDVAVVSPVATNEQGRFSVGPIQAGTYRLLVENADKTLSLVFPLVVPSSVPAVDTMLIGDVFNQTSLAVGWLVRARLYPTGLSLSGPGVILVPKKWNLRSMTGSGKVKALFFGTGLDLINKVTLETKAGSLSTTSISVGLTDLVASASFARTEILANLIPAGAKRGDLLDVTIRIEVAGLADPLIYTRQVVLLEPRRKSL